MKTQDADFRKHNEALYKLGMRYYAERKWAKAVETFEKLRKRDPHYENLSRSLWKARIRLVLKQPASWIVVMMAAVALVVLCLTGVGGMILFGSKATPAPAEIAMATTVVPTAQTLLPSPSLPPTVTPTPEMDPTPSRTPTPEPEPPSESGPPSKPEPPPEPEPPSESGPPSEPESPSEPEPPPEPEPPSEPEPPPMLPLSGQIAFPVCDPKRDTCDIWLASVDGSNRQLVVEEASEPAISPNGSKIAFRSWNDSTLGLMVSNIDGTQPQRVSRGLEDACPYWAFAELLVFHSTKEGPTPRLYTAGTWEGANGLNNVQDMRYHLQPIYGQYPAWVPHNRIVYKYFDQAGNYRGLYIVNADGSNPTPVTDNPDDTMPSVSPRGDKVAFMSRRTGKWEVFVVNIDGSGLKQLTHSGSYESGLPTWSPDGNYIAFVSNREDQWAIWVINGDGSGERKLFDLDGPLPWWERISWGPKSAP